MEVQSFLGAIFMGDLDMEMAFQRMKRTRQREMDTRTGQGLDEEPRRRPD